MLSSICLAPSAQHSISSLGQRPGFMDGPNASAESAIHHQREFD
jgi:hypothetical protein